MNMLFESLEKVIKTGLFNREAMAEKLILLVDAGKITEQEKQELEALMPF